MGFMLQYLADRLTVGYRFVQTDVREHYGNADL